MVQALTTEGTPLPKNLLNTVYSIAKNWSTLYLLSKANRVYRVESLIFQKKILMSWLIDENKMVKELRSSKAIASRVGGVCCVGHLPSLPCLVKSIC